eukprot:548500_1
MQILHIKYMHILHYIPHYITYIIFRYYFRLKLTDFIWVQYKSTLSACTIELQFILISPNNSYTIKCALTVVNLYLMVLMAISNGINGLNKKTLYVLFFSNITFTGSK